MNYQLTKLRAQCAILKELVKEYPCRTMENVVGNLEQRIKALEEIESKNNLQHNDTV